MHDLFAALTLVYRLENQSGFVAATRIFMLALHLAHRAVTRSLRSEPVGLFPVFANQVCERLARRQAYANAVLSWLIVSASHLLLLFSKCVVPGVWSRGAKRAFLP